MASPVIQFKRGALANLPGLRAGEPGWTTDVFDLYVGVNSTTAENKIVGSHRFWTNSTTSTGSGVNLVEGTSNGTSFITLKSPDSLAGIVTYTFPGTDGSNGQVITTDGNGNLSFATVNTSFTASSTDTLTNKTFDANGTGNSLSNVEVADFAASAIVTEGEGISSNDNDTTLPTSAAVKDYTDTAIAAVDLTITTAEGTNGTGGGGGSVATSQTLTFGGTSNEINVTVSGQSVTYGLPNDVTVSNNLTVTGNLYVNGSTTQVNTSQTTIEDQLLELGIVDGSAPSSDLNKDLGVLFNYYNASAKKAGIYWDDSTSRIVVADDVSESSGVLTAASYAAFEIGSLYVNDCAGASQVISCSGSTRSLENISIDGGSF